MTTLRPPEGPWNGVIPEDWEEHTGERIPGLWCTMRIDHRDVWCKAYEGGHGLDSTLTYIKPKEKKVEKEKLKPLYLLQWEDGSVTYKLFQDAKTCANGIAKDGQKVTIFKSILEVSPGEPKVKEYEA